MIFAGRGTRGRRKGFNADAHELITLSMHRPTRDAEEGAGIQASIIWLGRASMVGCGWRS